MVTIFGDDPLLQAIDPRGRLIQDFVSLVSHATQLGAHPGGLPYWVGRNVPMRTLQNGLAMFGLESIAWQIYLGIGKGIGSFLARD